MNRNVELALLAGASYESSRRDMNKFPVPEGWTALNIAGWPYGSQSWPETNVPGRVYWQDSATGFEAAAYVKGSEVVVSFAGTYFEGELKPDMFDNNVPLGAGKLTDQLRQAAEFVVRLKQNPAMAGKSMVLTGHSLGGGLASAIGVMLDVQAVTFDPAPFRAAASMESAQALNAHLERQGLAPDAKLASYTTSGQVPVPVGLALRLAAGAATAAGLPSVVMVPVTVAREANVRAIALKGEMLTGEGVDLSVRDALRIYDSGLDLVEVEAQRLPTLGAAAVGAQVQGNIQTLQLDYQLAVLQAQRTTANSQFHYDQPVPVFIEDQPLMRGSGHDVAMQMNSAALRQLNSKKTCHRSATIRRFS